MSDKNQRVLIIDDNRAIHDDFRKILSPATSTDEALDATEAALFGESTEVVAPTRFHIDSAYQGQEGLERVIEALGAGLPYAMAFVDVRMPPGWDGVETTRKIWEVDPDIQIVLCTAYSDYSWDAMFAKLGHRDGLLILKKPFDGVEALQLAHALTQKWWLHRQSLEELQGLERRVGERTSELQHSNRALTIEIAEHQRAERMLRVSEEQFRQLAANVTDVFWMATPDFLKMHYVSPAYERVWGRSVDSLHENPHQWIDAILAKDRDSAAAVFAALGADRPAVSVEYRIERPDGSMRWILDRGFIVRDAAGEVVRHTGIATDITERKQAEEEAARLHKRLRDLIDGLGPSMFVGLLTPDGVMVECNRPALMAAGLSPDDVLGKHFEDTYWWSHSDPVRKRLRASIEAAARGSASRYDVRIRVQGGALVDAEFSLEPMRDETGTIVFLVPSGVIITERKRAELALQDSEERYRALIEWSPESLSVTRGGTILFLNPAAVKLLGASCAQELIGKSILEFVHPDFRQLVEARVKLQAELGGVVPMLEQRLIRLDGTIIEVEIHGTSIVFDGTPALFSSIRDVTERKRFDDALRESERRFSDMLQNLELASMMLDTHARVTYANEYLLRLTDWKLEDVIGKDWFEILLPPEDVVEARKQHAALLAGLPTAWHFENEIVTHSGARRLMRWTHSVLRAATGEVTGTASIGEDITERRRLETQLFESQKLETVGTLAGGVAHEFNSILTAIMGQSEVLLGELPPGSALVRHATEIRKAADRAAVLTRQLLAYGRKQFLKSESVDLNRILASMGDMLRHLMGVEIDVQIASAPNLRSVRADAGQIEQVIMNLAINARDAMPHGGRLTFETANVSFDNDSAGGNEKPSPGDFVMLAITDTGLGMTEDVKARIFEPFFTTKGVGQGTGLGLSTCYGILRQSGGHIGVHSQLARGTTFKIYLPQVEQQAKLPVRGYASSELPRGTETVLLVEDESALRELASSVLTRLGYTVFPAVNGIEAFRLMQQKLVGRVDLVLTDLAMPHVSGRELSKRVLAIHPHARVLFTGAYTENAMPHRGLLGESVSLLQKPYTPSALAVRVRKVLDDASAPSAVPIAFEFTQAVEESECPPR